MKKSFKKVLILLLTTILLIFLQRWGFFASLEDVFRVPFISLDRKFFEVSQSIKNNTNFFASKNQLIEENKKLKEENNRILLENKNLKIRQGEERILSKQLDFLNFLEEKKYNYVLCHIIGKTSDNLLATENLILDKGEKDGIKVGFPVIAEEGFLVGKIIKTEQNISYLDTILNNYSKIAAKVLNMAELDQEGIQGIVGGEYQLSLKMDFILPDKKIKKNDIVITSGLEFLIPRGLVIGRVREIKFEPGDFFQKAILDPLLDFDDLQIVSVLISN